MNQLSGTLIANFFLFFSLNLSSVFFPQFRSFSLYKNRILSPFATTFLPDPTDYSMSIYENPYFLALSQSCSDSPCV